jgi:segregation and condensation protein A
MFHAVGDKVLFTSMLEDDVDRENIVVTFLAMLELMKMKRVYCYQHNLFEDIVLEYRGEGDVDGVEPEEIDY